MARASLLLMSGSLRGASYNRMLVAEAGRFFDGATVTADLDMPLYNGDVEDRDGIPAQALQLHEQIAAADAVAISTPEYNQSLSGVLKNALDWVSRASDNPWADKPVAIMSAAAGRAGGARAQYALRLALNPFQPRLLTGPEVMVANPAAQFDDEHRLTSDLYRNTLEKLMAKLSADIRRGQLPSAETATG